jgi:hypothetical protein
MPPENEVSEVATPTLSGPISVDASGITVVGATDHERLVSYLVDFYTKAMSSAGSPKTMVFGSAALLDQIEASDSTDSIKPHLWLVELAEDNPRAPAPSAAMLRHDSFLHIGQRLVGASGCFTAKQVHDQATVGKHVAGGAIAPTVEALFEEIASDLLSDPAADLQLLMFPSSRLHVHFEGNVVTEDFIKWWGIPNLEREVTARRDFPDGPFLFGLEAQGHIPTVEAALAEGVDWREIGRRIGWDGETARTYYERYLARTKQQDGKRV